MTVEIIDKISHRKGNLYSHKEGRMGVDKDFEAKLRELEAVITLGRKLKIRN